MNALGLADDIIAQIAAGLAGRLRSLVMAIDRLDRLESGSGVWLSSFSQKELPGAATELTLRLLRTSADPTNFLILETLAAEGSHSLGHLIETTGLGRLALSERLNDLVQVGLASRLIDTDHAQITAAGTHLVHLFKALSDEVARQYPAAHRSPSGNSRWK